MVAPDSKVFERHRFSTEREWLFFCLEFDLQICHGCHQKARRVRGDKPEVWYCDECPSHIHPDLWTAIRTGTDPGTECSVCGERVPVRECWISDDCERLCCAKHLKPIHVQDRVEFTRAYAEGGSLAVDHNRLEQFFVRNCPSCPYNARGIYRGHRLEEIDRGCGRCDCAPDALNCAGVAN